MTWNRVAIDTLPLFGEPFNKRGGVANFAFRFRQRFTLFQRHQTRQIVLMFHHQIEPATQDIGSLFGGERAPGGQGAIGGVDGVARLFRPHFGHIAERFPVGGVAHGDDIAAARVAPVAIDKGLLAEQGRVVKLHNCFLSEGLTGKCGV